MTLLVFIGLFVPVMLSGGLMFIFTSGRKDTNWVKLLVAFSGAYLLALCFLDIIPEIYSTENVSKVGLLILGGFFIQIILDFFTHGVEHGHNQHSDDHYHEIPTSMIVALCIHSFLEGMPLASGMYNAGFQHKLLTGIIIHNIPISIVLSTFLLQADSKRSTSFILLTIFALSAPVGTVVSGILGEVLIKHISLFFSFTMAVVVGIFLHISTTILFESEENHKFNFYKLGFVLLGILIAVINM
ncbi:MAG: ZIP family metal transporter [Bacteroidota bacterium]|nr:ZIP family metal transporter [Bacteroidota bacterium]